MTYQDRKDIDNLYFLIWDREANDVLFATKEEFEELSSKVLDISQLDELFVRKTDINDTDLPSDFKDALAHDGVDVDTYGDFFEWVTDFILSQ